jgi:hypothetical protein
MGVITLLHLYAIIITIKNGFFSAIKLRGMNVVTGMEIISPRIKTEIRSTWGGLLLGLGIAGLVYPTPVVYKTLAIVYVARNAIRGISMIIEKSIDRVGLQGISYEIILAIILFL